MAILDNLYRKCYNKCNDDNKNVICYQTVKFTLYGVFAFRDIKSRRTTEKRFTGDLHKIWKYKKPEIVRRRRTAENGIPIYKQGSSLLKVCHAVTKWLQLSGCA